MKLKDIDNSLMEQDRSAEVPIPIGLPSGYTVPPSTGPGPQSMSDTERNIRNTLNALGPGIGRAANVVSRAGTRLGLSQAGKEINQIKAAELAAKKADLVRQAKAGAPFSSTRPSLSSGPNLNISSPVVTGPGRAAKDDLASIMARIEKNNPMSDFVKTGKREPTGPITGKSVQFSRTDPRMGSYRDPVTGQYTRYADDSPAGPSLGAPVPAKNIARDAARVSDVPVTRQAADVSGSALTRQVPGAGLPMPRTGLTPGQTAALGAAGLGVGATGGAIYGLGGSSSPNGTPPFVEPTQPVSQPAATQQSTATPASTPAAQTTPQPSAPVAVTNRDIANQVKSLAQSSGISDPNKIRVGQKITLPGGGSYTVKAGDNLWNISKRLLGGKLTESPELLDIKKLAGL